MFTCDASSLPWSQDQILCQLKQQMQLYFKISADAVRFQHIAVVSDGGDVLQQAGRSHHWTVLRVTSEDVYNCTRPPVLSQAFVLLVAETPAQTGRVPDCHHRYCRLSQLQDARLHCTNTLFYWSRSQKENNRYFFLYFIYRLLFPQSLYIF